MGEKSIRLIIVDDETGFADVLAKRMSRRGICADTANSGEEAIRILRGKSYDVAILDLKLEGMDGVEILKIFKLLDPEMPVLMPTGHSSEKAVTMSMKLGAADYLSKPIDFDLLISKIKQVCRSRSEHE